jgi:hypothetical protein
MGTVIGNMEGAPIPGTLKDNKRYIKRAVKMPCRWVSLSLGAPMGNLEGIRLPGLLREKDSIFRFLSWTQRILSLRAIWNCVRGTGLS